MLIESCKNLLLKYVIKNDLLCEFLYNKKIDYENLIKLFDSQELNEINCENRKISTIYRQIETTSKNILLKNIEKAIFPIDKEIDSNNIDELRQNFYKRNREVNIFTKNIIQLSNQNNIHIIFINPVDTLSSDQIQKTSILTDLIRKETNNIFYTNLNNFDCLRIYSLYISDDNSKKIDLDIKIKESIFKSVNSFLNLINVKNIGDIKIDTRSSRYFEKLEKHEFKSILNRIEKFITFRQDNQELSFENFEKEYNKKSFLDSIKEVS